MNTRPNDVKNLLIAEGEARSLPAMPMADAGWTERGDLQRWVRAHPELIDADLLLISEELADWEAAGNRVLDRLDLLFLDADGHPMVVELKRGVAPDRSESQALLYAAYCDQLSTSDLVEQYARTHSVDSQEAREAINGHAPLLADDQPGRVRVRLVAEDFPPSVTATVLFLRDIGSGGPETSQLDIGCVKLTAYELSDDSHLISAQPIIPVPETEAYQVSRRRREADDESSRARRTRVANAVPTLQRSRAIEAGTKLRPKLDWFSDREREAVERLLQRDPSWAELEWTGESNARRAVLSGLVDEPASLDAAYQWLRQEAGLNPAPDATSAWTVGDTGKSVRELADDVLAREEAS
ncbi:MAG: hypothetical protein ACR2KD_06740 [Thermoleophilaceae bacterium]